MVLLTVEFWEWFFKKERYWFTKRRLAYQKWRRNFSIWIPRHIRYSPPFKFKPQPFILPLILFTILLKGFLIHDEEKIVAFALFSFMLILYNNLDDTLRRISIERAVAVCMIYKRLIHERRCMFPRIRYYMRIFMDLFDVVEYLAPRFEIKIMGIKNLLDKRKMLFIEYYTQKHINVLMIKKTKIKELTSNIMAKEVKVIHEILGDKFDKQYIYQHTKPKCRLLYLIVYTWRKKEMYYKNGKPTLLSLILLYLKLVN